MAGYFDERWAALYNHGLGDADIAAALADEFGDDFAELAVARIRVLEREAAAAAGTLEGLGDAAMAVANDCQGYLDDEDGPGPREMMHAFLGTLRPAIEAAFPGESPPYGAATTAAATVYVAWGPAEAEGGRLSVEVRDPDGALPPARGPGSERGLSSQLDRLLLDDPEWEAFEAGLSAELGVELQGEGGERAHGWRLPAGEPEKSARLLTALVDRLRGLGLEVGE